MIGRPATAQGMASAPVFPPVGDKIYNTLAHLTTIGGSSMNTVHVPGTKSKHIMLYALSTCGWCHKAKKFLDGLGVEYEYVYVDQLEGDDKKAVVRDVKQWNPACSFPTLVIDNKKCIVGYDEADIRKAVSK